MKTLNDTVVREVMDSVRILLKNAQDEFAKSEYDRIDEMNTAYWDGARTELQNALYKMERAYHTQVDKLRSEGVIKI